MIETINIVNKEVSKLLNIDETLVKVINQFYWKHGVKAAIQSGGHTSIRLKNIGTLVTSRTKVNNKILRLIKSIREFKRPEKVFKTKTKEECLSEKYTELKLLLQRRNDIAIAYKSNTDRTKQKYELPKTNLGEQTPDNARIDSKTILKQEYTSTSFNTPEGMQDVSFQQSEHFDISL